MADRDGEIEVLGTFSDGRLKVRRWMRLMTDEETGQWLVQDFCDNTGRRSIIGGDSLARTIAATIRSPDKKPECS